jgi:hypothetical protein
MMDTILHTEQVTRRAQSDCWVAEDVIGLVGRMKQSGSRVQVRVTPTCVKDSGMVEKCCRFVPTPALRARERSSVH